VVCHQDRAVHPRFEPTPFAVLAQQAGVVLHSLRTCRTSIPNHRGVLLRCRVAP
jgi:hypothetical protein